MNVWPLALRSCSQLFSGLQAVGMRARALKGGGVLCPRTWVSVVEYVYYCGDEYTEEVKQKSVEMFSESQVIQPHKVFTLLSRRGATEHSSTRPRFSTHNLLIVFKYVCIHIANKLGNLKKKNLRYHIATQTIDKLRETESADGAPRSGNRYYRTK
jgi:hypothetical protein